MTTRTYGTGDKRQEGETALCGNHGPTLFTRRKVSGEPRGIFLRYLMDACADVPSSIPFFANSFAMNDGQHRLDCGFRQIYSDKEESTHASNIIFQKSRSDKR